MTKYLLGGREFSTKTAVKKLYKGILDESDSELALTGQEFGLVMILLTEGCHPRTPESVQAIYTPAGLKKAGVFLVVADGLALEIAYKDAIDGEPLHYTNVMAALRGEIKDQILAFRAGYNGAFEYPQGVMCELCLGLVTPSGAHVDYHPETAFDELAKRFVDVVGGWTALEIVGTGAGRSLKDRDLAGVWLAFHSQAASLRITHSRCPSAVEVPVVETAPVEAPVVELQPAPAETDSTESPQGVE